MNQRILIEMGFFGKIGDVFNKIDYHTSNDPEIVGKRFEDDVEELFSTEILQTHRKNPFIQNKC